MARGARILRRVVTASILLFALLFLALAFGSHRQLVESRRLLEAGATTEGVVTEAVTARRGTATSFSYRFEAAGRGYAAARRSIPWGLREENAAGSRVKVWYDTANPNRSVTMAEMAELENWANRLFFPIAGVALLGWAIARMRGAGASAADSKAA